MFLTTFRPEVDLRLGSEDKYCSLIDSEQIGYLVVDFGEFFFDPFSRKKNSITLGSVFFYLGGFVCMGKIEKKILPKSILMFTIVFIMFLE